MNTDGRNGISSVKHDRLSLLVGWLTIASIGALCQGASVAQTTSAGGSTHGIGREMAEEHHHEEGATHAMSEAHAHIGPHMKWTARRTLTLDDEARADRIIRTLREALARYQDYRVAIKDGFEPFHPELPLSRYHFTSKWRGFKAAFRFHADEPTSLLYKKTEQGYELEGAMYTAPKRMNENRLNERVPLSVGQWHAHVNLCFPPKGSTTSVDWTRFGFKGTIATEEECDAADGRFYSQVFGWMLHVYPFEERSDRIWTH